MDRDDVINLIKAKKRIGDLARTTRQRTSCPFCGAQDFDLQLYHDTNRFRCWNSNCGRHGSVIDWVMHEKGYNFNEAVRELATSMGIDMSMKDNRAPVLQTVSRSFVRALATNSEVTDYWVGRGITTDTLYRHHVGYCSDEVLKGIARHTDPSERVDWPTLEDCALTVHGKPAFWDHTIFPYRHWKTRQIVQMQGRKVGEVSEGDNRWKGLATKSKLGHRNLNAMLWGEEELLNYWRRPGVTGKTYAFVCEGVPDALTLRQNDIHALSIIGNQSLAVQTGKLAQLDEVYLILDNDKSSQAFLPWELYDLMLQMPKTRLRTVTIPSPGTKPDGSPIKLDVNDYFRAGATAGDFGKLVGQSPDATMFLVDSWGREETKYEPLLTMICERPLDERDPLLYRLSSHGLFTMDQLEAFTRMLRLDSSCLKSRYRRSRIPQPAATQGR